MSMKLLPFRASLPDNDNVLRHRDSNTARVGPSVAPMTSATTLPIRRGAARLNEPRDVLDKADRQWLAWRWVATHQGSPRLPAPTQPRPKPDVSRIFDSVVRPDVPPMPHPIWRLSCAFGRGLEKFLSGLRTAMLVYYALCGLVAIPLLVGGHYLSAAVMAGVGGCFATLLWLSHTTDRRPSGEATDAEYASQHYRVRP